jgi:hypothetical protein
MTRTTIATVLATAFAIAALCFAEPAAAATKECRHIQARKDRNLCYEEQAKQKKAAPAPRAPMDAQLEQMKRENERVQQRVKSICRGW